MSKFFKCLNEVCGKEFKSRDNRECKFCQRSCYKETRLRIGTKALGELQAVLIRETPSRVCRPKAQEPDKEVIVKETTETVIVQPEDTAEVIHFEDLTINQLQEIISNLLEKVETCETEIEKLIRNDKYDQLRKLVDDFLLSLLQLGLDDYDLSQLKTPAPVVIESQQEEKESTAPLPVEDGLSLEKKLHAIRSSNGEIEKPTNHFEFKPVAVTPPIPIPLTSPHAVIITDDGIILDKSGIVQVRSSS